MREFRMYYKQNEQGTNVISFQGPPFPTGKNGTEGTGWGQPCSTTVGVDTVLRYLRPPGCLALTSQNKKGILFQDHGTSDCKSTGGSRLSHTALLIPAMPSPMSSDVILFGLGSFLNRETVKKYPAPLAAMLIKEDPRVLPSCSKTHQLMHLLTPRGRDSTGLPPPMQITPRSAAGLLLLLLGNAPG